MGVIRRVRTAWSRHHRSAGFGIHSPHAFRFVTEVLGERRAYYAYDDIRLLRQAVIAAENSHWPHPRVMSNKNARMLLRITNHFNPSRILQVGTTYAMSTAVMLAVSSQSRLWLHEPHLDRYPVTELMLRPVAERVTHSTELDTLLDDYLMALGDDRPFVLVNNLHDDKDLTCLTDALTAMLSNEATLLFRHIDSDQRVKRVWDACCQALTAGQTYTNEKTGILIANPKLQREHFDLWF